MKILELFSGTQSVGKVGEELGYDVISVDINDYGGKYIPTHKIDILDFDYKQYDEFDVIWCSPPCCFYSQLQVCWLGQYKIINGVKTLWTKDLWNASMIKSDKLVKKCLEIIKYFKPKLWFIENPNGSKLKTREFMTSLPYYVVDYCRYSDFGYKKPTRVWTNKKDFKTLRCERKCGYIKKIKGRWRHDVDVAKDRAKLDRYRIPKKLIYELIT
tara:strand:+ start:26 stop:667 length:642 start_codon:yes stop_codon:yes gene_type:complete